MPRKRRNPPCRRTRLIGRRRGPLAGPRAVSGHSSGTRLGCRRALVVGVEVAPGPLLEPERVVVALLLREVERRVVGLPGGRGGHLLLDRHLVGLGRLLERG